MGIAQEKVGDFSNQLKSYLKAIELSASQPVWVYLVSGRLLSETGADKQSVDTLRNAASLYPNDPDIYYHLGNALCNAGKNSQALSAYEQALKIKPDFHLFYQGLGEAYSRLGKNEDAVTCFCKAIDLEPTFPWSYSSLVDIYINDENWLEAKHFISRGLFFCSDNTSLVIRKIKVLELTEDVEIAEEYALEEFEIGCQEIDVILELNRIFLKHEKIEKSKDLLSSYLTEECENPHLFIELAKLEQKQGHFDKAESLSKKAIEASSEQSAIALEAALVLSDSWKLAASKSVLGKACKKYPNNLELLEAFTRISSQALLHSGKAHIVLSDLSEILENYQRLLSAEWDCGDLHFQIADLLDRAEDVHRACHIYEKAVIDSYNSANQIALAKKVIGEFSAGLNLDGLSEEQLSHVLMIWGGHHASGQRLMHSLGCYRLALKINPANYAAAFNLGNVYLELKEIHGAIECYDLLYRVYDRDTSQMLWFRKDGCAWPQRSFKLADTFEKLKPLGIKWPKISITIPSFNQVAYVEETLLSVIHQEYPNLEIIVYDAVSTDGTQKILRQYEEHMTVLVIEPDKGQSNAINKGLQRATGDLLYWLNTDDMMAPGTLFMAALTYIKTKCDLVVGLCISHKSNQMNLINRPAVRQHDFTVEGMADLFKLWYKGHFFYQPEVFFSRQIWEKSGGAINEDLYYTMDYDMWLRFARHGAKVEVIGWPFALFRQHPQQKTASFSECMREQFAVRNQYCELDPPFSKQLALSNRLRSIFRLPHKKIAIISARATRIFSDDTYREISEYFTPKGYQVSFHKNTDNIDAASLDLAIFLVHIQNEHLMMKELRSRGFDGPIVGWFWDNHHHYFANAEIAESLDITIPGHGFAEDGLRNRSSLLLPAIPLCTTQWTMKEAKSYFLKYSYLARSDELHGGFTWYDFAEKRNSLINAIQRDLPNTNVFTFTEENQKVYFGLSLEQRFSQWANYKTSLCLPLREDLSQRLFDALLTGQIPIVPNDVLDLNDVIPVELQQKLPIVTFQEYTVDSVKQAHQRALEQFDAEGASGIKRRHEFVLDKYMFPSAISSILKRIENIFGDSAQS